MENLGTSTGCWMVQFSVGWATVYLFLQITMSFCLANTQCCNVFQDFAVSHSLKNTSPIGLALSN